MKKLVVLVGLPGSGKTSFCRAHSDWVIVSKNDIRRAIFRATYAPDYEEAVERIYASALVEAIESPADVICIDHGNLTRSERAMLVEVGHLSGREVVAHVMPLLDVDSLYERTRRTLRRLAMEDPSLKVVRFPRDRFDALAQGYEPVEPAEGFTRVIEEAGDRSANAMKQGTAGRRAKPESRDPLPLFVS